MDPRRLTEVLDADLSISPAWGCVGGLGQPGAAEGWRWGCTASVPLVGSYGESSAWIQAWTARLSPTGSSWLAGWLRYSAQVASNVSLRTRCSLSFISCFIIFIYRYFIPVVDILFTLFDRDLRQVTLLPPNIMTAAVIGSTVSGKQTAGSRAFSIPSVDSNLHFGKYRTEIALYHLSAQSFLSSRSTDTLRAGIVARLGHVSTPPRSGLMSSLRTV